jgi:hypothetical protein
MSKDIKSIKNERRQTRSDFISDEDKKLYNNNFIDNFYSKKKKSTYQGKTLINNLDNRSNVKNDSSKFIISGNISSGEPFSLVKASPPPGN